MNDWLSYNHAKKIILIVRRERRNERNFLSRPVDEVQKEKKWIGRQCWICTFSWIWIVFSKRLELPKLPCPFRALLLIQRNKLIFYRSSVRVPGGPQHISRKKKGPENLKSQKGPTVKWQVHKTFPLLMIIYWRKSWSVIKVSVNFRSLVT